MVNVRDDLTGRVFGRLTVLEQAEDYIDSKGRHYDRWLCECSCEKHNKKIVRGSDLRGQHILSCGCLMREKASSVNKKYNEWIDEVFSDEHGEYKIGITNNTGRQFYVDIEDFDLLKEYCWCECKIQDKQYSLLKAYDPATKKLVRMSKVLGCLGYDHEDRNTFNNRRYNLRPCTILENAKNISTPKDNTSGFIGVSWRDKYKKWIVRISDRPRHQIYLGAFDNKYDAIKTRLQAEADYYGEFAPQKHLFEEYGIVYNTGDNTQ